MNSQSQNKQNSIIKIEGMTCSSCVARVEKQIHKINNTKAQINLVTNTAYIEHDIETDITVIAQEIEKLGYKTTIVENTKQTQNPTSSIKTKQTHEYENQNNKVKIPYNKFSNNYIDSNFDKVIAQPEEENETPKNKYNIKLIVSIILTTFTLSILIPLGGHNKTIIYITALISLIVSLWCGSTFHKNAYKNIKHLYLTMDSLVSLSVLSSIIWSIIQLVFTQNPVLHNHFTLNILNFQHIHNTLHFDSAMMITTFILLGKWIENKAKNQGTKSLKDIINLEAKHATLINSNNKTTLTPIENIKNNDLLIVKNGETIPTDGIIVEGESEINTMMLTGETLPKYVTVGDEVIGGTLNTFGTLKIRVTKTGSDTMLSQIIKSVIDSQNHKPKIQKLVDKISAIFTPIIIITAIASAIIWYLNGANLNTTISIAITILVVACPCALGLATPMALIVSSSTATKNGILIKDLQILEQTQKITTMIFDKTGTITTGNLTVNTVESTENMTTKELIEITHLAEQGSNHPISEAITKYVEKNPEINIQNTNNYEVKNHINYAGCGVEATINNQRIYVGKIKWIQKMGCEIPETLLRVIAQTQYTGSIVTIIAEYDTTQEFEKSNLKPLGIITFNDNIKPHTKQVIDYLKQEKIQPLLVTGDNIRNAIYVANRTGIDENNIRAEIMPIHKKEIVLELQEQNQHVAMIGDGINDAPALSQASSKGISFSFTQGSDLAIYASDITLLNNDITLVSKTFQLAKKTLKVIKQNLLWAFAYNIIAIPLAALGYINPSIAAIAMVSSSIIVVSNSLRLQKIK